MTLGELIDYLRGCDQSHVCPIGFGRPHSYRGYYSDLAFEPARDIPVYDMLECAESSLGKTFVGYKGGDNLMSGWTDVWLANYSECGELIGPVLLGYMTGTLSRALPDEAR